MDLNDSIKEESNSGVKIDLKTPSVKPNFKIFKNSLKEIFCVYHQNEENDKEGNQESQEKQLNEESKHIEPTNQKSSENKNEKIKSVYSNFYEVKTRKEKPTAIQKVLNMDSPVLKEARKHIEIETDPIETPEKAIFEEEDEVPVQEIIQNKAVTQFLEEIENLTPQDFTNDDKSPKNNLKTHKNQKSKIQKNPLINGAVDNIVEDVIESLMDHLAHDETFARLVKKPQAEVNDLEKVKEYTTLLFDHISQEVDTLEGIVLRLNTPIGMSNQQRLLMCSPTLPKENFSEADFTFEYLPILEISTYISLEEKLRNSLYEDLNLDSVEMEQQHIFHKMIFDSLNETLDYKRLHGLTGIPMSFSIKEKQSVYIGVEQAWSLLFQAKDEIEKWSILRNGILPEKEPDLTKIKDFDAIEFIREEKVFDLIQEYVNTKILIY